MLFTFDIFVQCIIGSQMHPCLTILFILMFSIWPIPVSVTYFFVHCVKYFYFFSIALIPLISIRQSFNHTHQSICQHLQKICMSFCDPYVWAIRKKQSGVEGGGDKANRISRGLGFLYHGVTKGCYVTQF